MRHPSRAVSELMERFSVTRQLAEHIDEYLGNVAAAVRDDQRKANAADLAALRAENARLREALSALLDEYRVRMFAIGHTYDDIDSQVVVTESRAALAAAPAANRD